MFISDRDALQYASRMILILVPFVSSLFDIWSWVIEILLLFAVFIHAMGSGLQSTIFYLAAGYSASLIPAVSSDFLRIGFSPWAGIIFLVLKKRGLSTSYSMFWGFITAALLSALPLIPAASAALQPDNLQQRLSSILQFYEQEGIIAAFEKQGITAAELERNLRMIMPVYYQLLPAFAGIAGLLELGISYIVFKISLRKTHKMGPFALFRQPWYAVWFAIIGLAAYLGGDYLKIQIIEILGLNMMTVMGTLALIQGLACMTFLLKHPRVPKIVSGGIIFIGVLLPYFMGTALVLVGLFDFVMNFRRIPENIEEGY